MDPRYQQSIDGRIDAIQCGVAGWAWLQSSGLDHQSLGDVPRSESETRDRDARDPDIRTGDRQSIRAPRVDAVDGNQRGAGEAWLRATVEDDRCRDGGQRCLKSDRFNSCA